MAVETRHPERAQAPSDLSALHIGYAVAEGGGAETFVRQVARFLVLSGHRVTVLYIGYPGQPQRPPAIEDGVHIEYVGITNLHYFYSRVQSLRPSTVGQMLSSGAVKAAEQSFALRRALQCITRVRGAFDLIEVPEGTILPTLFRRLAPYAVKLHSSESTWRHFCNEGLGQEDFQRFRLESTLLHGAVCVSAPSAAVADHVAAMCTFPRSRIEIVPNLVDVDRFRPGNLPAQEKDSVLYVGRLDPRKGLRSLALAAEAVLLGSPTATIDIVGGETDEVTAESFLGDVPASLRHRVRFHGRIPYDRLLSYYRRAGVVVVPSRWDNSPLTIYEAMACGVPVVATNVGGIPELVEDGETGLLIPHDDPGALAGAVLSLLRAPRRRTEMGLRARSIAEGKYAPAAVADVTARMYRTALHRRTAVSGAAIMT